MRKYVTYLIILIVSACSSNDVFDLETQHESTLSDAYEHVVKIAQEALGDITLKSRANSVLSVESVTPWLTVDLQRDDYGNARSAKDVFPDTLLYAVAFKNKAGSVLVSCNQLYEGPVAILPQEYLGNCKDAMENEGFKLFVGLYCESVKNGHINKTFSEDEFMPFLSKALRYTSPESSDWATVTDYPVKLIQKWGQRSPYNKYCFTADGKQALAGCLPVAFAQVLTYYKYPNTINGYKIYWSSTNCEKPTSAYQQDDVARLIHELGVLCDAEYGVSSTKAPVKKMNLALTKMGYEYRYDSTQVAIHETMMIHNLAEYGPALVYGAANLVSAHEWVIDGALAQRRTIDGKSELRFLYHCNWGWNGSQDGYFLSTAFNPYGDNSSPNYQFNYIVRPTYFIKKKN